MRNFKFNENDDGFGFDFGMSSQNFYLTDVNAITFNYGKSVKFYNYKGGNDEFACMENVKKSFSELKQALKDVPYIAECGENSLINTDLLIDFSSVINNKKDLYRINLHFDAFDLTCRFKSEQEVNKVAHSLINKLSEKENTSNF